MPEGDTLFRAARTLHRALAGGAVTRFESVYPALTRIHEERAITGRTVERVGARGKHLLMTLSGGLTLHTHLRMNGSWHLYRPGEAWQRPRADMRVVIATHEYVAVGFRVPIAEFLDDRAMLRHPQLAALGPDLLDPVFDEAEALVRLASAADEPVAEALLDQRVVAGIGNVYKSETLFVERVHPQTRVGDLDPERRTALLRTGRRLLQANVSDESGAAIVTWRGLRRTTRSSHPAERLWVYGRERDPCRRCGTPIRMEKTGPDARVTYWCPSCQRVPE